MIFNPEIFRFPYSNASTQIKAQILFVAQLVLIIFSLLAGIVYESVQPHGQTLIWTMDLKVECATLLIVAGLAVLNAIGFYSIAAAATLFTTSFSVFFMTLALSLQNIHSYQLLHYLIIPITLSSILLRFRWAVLFTIIIMSVLFLFPLTVPQEYKNNIFSISSFLMILSSLIMVTSWERNRILDAGSQERSLQEQKFKILTEHSADLTIIIGTDLTYKYISPSLERIAGYKIDSFISTKPSQFIDPRGLVKMKALTQAALEHPGVPFRLHDAKLQFADGSWHWFDLIFTAWPDMPGIEGILIHGRDISEYKKAEQQLRDREERYRLLAENAADVVFLATIPKGFQFLSPSVERMTGYSVFEAKNLNLENLFTPDSFIKAKKLLEDFGKVALKDTPEIPLLEFEFIRKDGTRFWGEIRVMLQLNGKNELTGLQGSCRDITDRKLVEEQRKKLEDELRQSEKMQAIGQLAGGIAHDFNNQLTSILANADMMVRDPETTPDNRELAEAIVTAARRSADLTAKLLTFARKGTYRKEPVNIHNIINEVAGVLEHSIDKRITIHKSFSPSTIVTLGDSTLLQNAFLNLALNARDAMPGGGELTFSTSTTTLDDHFCISNRFHPKPGDYVEVQVTDTGVGMTDTTLEHLFEPFYTTKEVGKGTGMGLAAVYGSIESHQGAIEVISAPGKGATFKIFLPLSQSMTNIVGEETYFEADFEPKRMNNHILMIDDEELICRVAASSLRKSGYEVLIETHPVHAIEYYKTEYPNIDLIILDIVMPKMNGREVLLALKKINPRVQVLLTSGYSLDGEAKGIMEIGVQDFIQKPFDVSELLSKVRRILETE